MEKHAFMIMAHNDPDMLKLLLESLDDIRNDIYLHIDARSKMFDIDGIKHSVKNAHIEIFSEIECLWGDFSLVKCELFLLKKATSKHHRYYHLLSGTDYPLKNMDYIHDFFSAQNGREFVFFTSENMEKRHKKWYSKYHYLQAYCRRSKFAAVNYVIDKIEKVSIFAQSIIGVNRKKHYEKIYKGSQWFSITEEFAKYVISQERWIENDFKFTFASDEMVMPTLIMNSEFIENLYIKAFDNSMEQNLRYIVFIRGIPKTLSMSDYSAIKESDCVFGRKFSSKDSEIINHIKSENSL